MRLFEYQAKQIVQNLGIPIPYAKTAPNPIIAKQIFNEIGRDVVLKAQILGGNRGRLGGIRLAKDEEQVCQIATELFGLHINSQLVKKILVEEAILTKTEFQIGIRIDFIKYAPVIYAKNLHGKNNHDDHTEIFQSIINPLVGIQEFVIRDMAIFLGIRKSLWKPFFSIIKKLFSIFCSYDMKEMEINTLALTENDQFIVLGVNIDIDELALFRQPEIANFSDLLFPEGLSSTAKKYGINYLDLHGDIGTIANGNALSLAVVDALHHKGGKAGNLMNIGTQYSAERTAAGLHILLEKKELRAILMAIFGGFSVNESALQTTIECASQYLEHIPIFLFLTNKDKKIDKVHLEKESIYLSDSFMDAVHMCIGNPK